MAISEVDRRREELYQELRSMMATAELNPDATDRFVFGMYAGQLRRRKYHDLTLADTHIPTLWDRYVAERGSIANGRG